MWKVILKILQGVFYIYLIVALFIFTPYNNYKFAKENGFAKWLFLGEVVPTLQATIWPYYVYDSYFSNSVSSDDKKYFLETISALQAINNELVKQNPSKSTIIDYLDAAIQESNKLKPSKIEKNIAGFTEAFNSLRECLPELRKAFIDEDNGIIQKLVPKLNDWDKFTARNADGLNKVFF